MIAKIEPTEIQRIFAALAADATEPGVKLLASLEPLRVLWASPDAADLFGSSDPARLSRIVFGRTAAGRPLATRLDRLTPASGLHLERIVVPSRFARSGVILACRAVPYRTPKTVLLEAPRCVKDVRMPAVRDTPRTDLPEAAGSIGGHELPPLRADGGGLESDGAVSLRYPEYESEGRSPPDASMFGDIPRPTDDLLAAPIDPDANVPDVETLVASGDADVPPSVSSVGPPGLTPETEPQPTAGLDEGTLPAEGVETQPPAPVGDDPDIAEPPVEGIRRVLDASEKSKVTPLRDFAGVAAAKVVHLATFKAGQPALSGKAVPRREALRGSEETPQSEPLDAPQWAEAPGSGDAAREQQLSSHERFNFDEIARALAALPGAETTRLTTLDTAAPHVVSPTSPTNHALEDQSREGGAWAVLDALPTGVLVLQGDAVVYGNKALLDLLGYARIEDVRDRGGLAGLFPNHADHQPSLAHVQREVVLRGGGDRDLKVDARIQAITWRGSPAVVLSVRRPDSTGARLHKGPALDAARLADLHEALDLAAAGVGYLDAQGRILSLNGGAERLFGYEQREVIGDTATVLFAQDEQAAWRSFLADFVSEGSGGRRSAFRKFAGRRRNGRPIPLALSLRRLDQNRTCVVWQESWHGHAADSELDVLRREAERASALKSEFLAKVSHEIRTPLNAILGFTEIILEERFGPVANDRYREYLKDIHTSGTHVVSLVNDLLDLTRIEQGGLDLDLVPVDVNAMLAACVATLQGQAHRDRVIIRTSFATCAPVALADQRAFRQIALNLLSNAVKFNEPGGQVIVSSAITETGQVTVRIRDTGPGMSDSEIETAMKPFRQLATPKASGGSGLGLPLTKAMVEASQGYLRLSSKPGEGTLAEVTLQRVPDAALSVPAE